MLGRALLVTDIIRPREADEILGSIEARFEEQGADQRFDDVADDIVALGSPVLARLLAEPDVAGNAKLAADLGAGLARYKRIEALRHLAFGFVGEALVQPAGGDEAQHPVAEELQPVVAVPADAGVGDGALEQLEVAHLAPEDGLQEALEITHGR